MSFWLSRRPGIARSSRIPALGYFSSGAVASVCTSTRKSSNSRDTRRKNYMGPRASDFVSPTTMTTPRVCAPTEGRCSDSPPSTRSFIFCIEMARIAGPRRRAFRFVGMTAGYTVSRSCCRTFENASRPIQACCSRSSSIFVSMHAIEVELDEVSIDNSSVQPSPKQCVRLRVHDNGIGMAEATRQRVFEPFSPPRGSAKAAVSV